MHRAVIMSKEFAKNELETQAIAVRLAKELFQHQPVFIVLNGPLGAGKTTFARGFIKEWTQLAGEPENKNIISPTYNIVRVYGTRSRVAHIDLYRLSTREELEQIGFEHHFYELPCCLVEWLDKIPNAERLVPKSAIKIEFEFAGSGMESGRNIKISDF